MFLVCNGKAAKVLCHMLLHPRFLPSLPSGWNHKWHWVAPAHRLNIPVWYSTRTVQTNQFTFWNHKPSKFQCTDQLHFAEHLQPLPHILRIQSIWILDVFTWSFLTQEAFEVIITKWKLNSNKKYSLITGKPNSSTVSRPRVKIISPYLEQSEFQY